VCRKGLGKNKNKRGEFNPSTAQKVTEIRERWRWMTSRNQSQEKTGSNLDRTLRETHASPSAHSGKAEKHSGKPSPSATLGEELPGMRSTGKRPSSSAKNRTLGEAFPECHLNPRGRVNAVRTAGLFFFKKKLFPECNTRGRNLFF
jgi:hypothetical protein